MSEERIAVAGDTRERIEYRLTRDEVAEFYREYMSLRRGVDIFRFVLLVIAVAAVYVACVLAGTNVPMIGYILAAVGVVVWIYQYFRIYKMRKLAIEGMPKLTTVCEVEGGRVYFTAIADSGEEKKIDFAMSDIKYISDCGAFWNFSFKRGGVFMRKSDIEPDSALARFIEENPLKLNNKARHRRIILAQIFAVGAILSFMIPFGYASYLSRTVGFYAKDLWVLLAPIPIPISSIIFGIVMGVKRNKYECAVCIAFGVFALLMLVRVLL